MRTERSVDKALERADAEPFVATATRRDGVAEAFPARERHRGIDARAESARRMRATEDLEVAPAAHVVDRRDPLLGDVAHRRVERRVLLGRERIGNRASDQVGGVVLEDSRWI